MPNLLKQKASFESMNEKDRDMERQIDRTTQIEKHIDGKTEGQFDKKVEPLDICVLTQRMRKADIRKTSR